MNENYEIFSFFFCLRFIKDFFLGKLAAFPVKIKSRRTFFKRFGKQNTIEILNIERIHFYWKMVSWWWKNGEIFNVYETFQLKVK